MMSGSEVTCRVNVILTIINPYRTTLSRPNLLGDLDGGIALRSKFDSVVNDRRTWDQVIQGSVITILGDSSGISQRELDAAPLVSAMRAVAVTPWV